jgi:ATP-dependent helicase/nuclease subunit A
MMVLASAGSGKTYQLSNRIIGSIAMGIAPDMMVALTFTRKAAGEFTDAILSKLAQASLSTKEAEKLQAELRRSAADESIDFLPILESLIHAMPRMTLGTMDGFFTKVVKAFPLELGISTTQFQLIEGTEASVLRDQLLQSLLQQELSEEETEQFFLAFRQSMMGREKIQVRQRLKDYTDRWHEYWINGGDRYQWGPSDWSGDDHIRDWMIARHAVAQGIIEAEEKIAFTHASQKKSWRKMAETFAEHATGSGKIGAGGSLLERLIELCASAASGDQSVKHYKEFTIPADVFSLIAEGLEKAARAELARAAATTRAVGEVIQVFDAVCERRLRRKGKFGFSDVKAKMGEWARQEDKRLMREALDYRLDAKYQHWLLDEFQDTSRADWQGLAPLIDEAMTNDEGTVFLVGDKKQAIYGWRGGDVRLFDELQQRYGSRWKIDQMEKSYRSATEVLALVNRVCGDVATMRELYGKAAERWEWQDHIAAKEDLRGHARVECITENEEKNARLQRMVKLLEEIDIKNRKLSCGILVRTNAELIEVADFLREHNYRVIEEGQRQPAKDHPLGVAIWHLLKWLADPADSFALEVVRMSFLWPILEQQMGEFIWSACVEKTSSAGVSGLVEQLIAPLWPSLSPFARHRSDDLLQALKNMDQSSCPSIKAAALAMENLVVVQSPGTAEVQVLTIHKSKGLGFDVVLLPLISHTSIPDYGKFEIAQHDNWISQMPPSWVRSLHPSCRAAETAWAEQQCYEAMCLLYVALTRAKRGLYVLLEQKELKEDNTSLAQWIRRSCGGANDVIFESGDVSCFEEADTTPTVPASPRPPLGPLVLRHKPKSASKEAIGNHAALQYGTAMHSMMESITWLDESECHAADDMAESLKNALQNPEFRAFLEKRQRTVELYREIPVQGTVGTDHVRGIIDRLHVFRDPHGHATRAEIIDYKTDRVENAEELRERHEEQLLIYRTLVAKALALDESVIECILLGLHGGLVAYCGSSVKPI